MNNSFCLIKWADHRSNGGTGITKLSPGSETLESVRLFGDAEIYLKDGPDGKELHSSKNDLSDFLEFHRKRTAAKS